MPPIRNVVNDALRFGDVLIGTRGGRALIIEVNDWVHALSDNSEATYVAAHTEHGTLLLDPEGISQVLWASETTANPSSQTLPTAVGITPVVPAAVPKFIAAPIPPTPWVADTQPTEWGPVPHNLPLIQEVDVLSLPSHQSSYRGTRKVGVDTTVDKTDKSTVPRMTPASTEKKDDTQPTLALVQGGLVTAQASNGEIVQEDPVAAARNAQIIEATSTEVVHVPTPDIEHIRQHPWGGGSTPFRPCFDTSCTAVCSYCEAKCQTGCPYIPDMGNDICDHLSSSRIKDDYPNALEAIMWEGNDQ